ncbi:MAG: hypothetical protein Q7U47_14925 [Paludibacter sp.]|nr:hypothetical protein [Paludibacter sp.]
MKKLFQLTLIILTVILWGCQDELTVQTTSNGAKDMSALKVSPDFDWSTAKTIEITITGLPTLSNVEAVKSTLTIKGEDKLFYSGFHAINEDLALKLVVPSNETKIQLKFGSIEKEATIENNKVTFSFIPTITDEK